jgi:hypothetical protein
LTNTRSWADIEFDEQGNLFNGEFTTTAADGSTISGVYSGTFTVLDEDLGRSELHVIWLEGTGRFEGVTGEGTVVCIHGLHVGAALEYVTQGVLAIP